MGFEQLAPLKEAFAKQALEKAKEQPRSAKPAQEQAKGQPRSAKPAHDPSKSRPRGPKPGNTGNTGNGSNGGNGANANAPANAHAGKRPSRPPRPAQPPADPVVLAIARLQRHFPAAFPKKPAPKLPLKLGIHADLLQEQKKLQLEESEITQAIATWCQGARYWACMTENAARVDLAGAPSGVVTAPEANRARHQARRQRTTAKKAEKAANVVPAEGDAAALALDPQAAQSDAGTQAAAPVQHVDAPAVADVTANADATPAIAAESDAQASSADVTATAKKALETATETAPEKTTDTATDKATDKATGKATEATSGNATEAASEKATEVSAAPAAEAPKQTS
ncbi:ProQ/FINO family protein [Alcaligenaceae bacterium A4P071]|nr:ProQ/FINO family protein [Alcaligenaceae bacterium A4P071]